MASALLRRCLPPTTTRTIQRYISTTAARYHASQTEEVENRAVQNAFDTHTVEDLHGMTAAEILAETGTRKDSKMRHFTGMFLFPKLLFPGVG
jgi:NADH dehydrogenase (ubiquinone) Fe-S protein 2